MGNILSYNYETSELVARNDTADHIVKKVYSFTLYNVNFTVSSPDCIWYKDAQWDATSVPTGQNGGLFYDITFNYVGVGDYYILNQHPYSARKIAQFRRIAIKKDNSNNIYDSNINYGTRFSWVSEKGLSTVNVDDADGSNTRDYSLQFLLNQEFIQQTLLQYETSAGQIIVDNTNTNIITISSIRIIGANEIGTNNNLFSQSIEFVDIHPDWTITKEPSTIVPGRFDYQLDYNGLEGDYYTFKSIQERIHICSFHQTIDQEESLINNDSTILFLTFPLEAGENILDTMIIDKICVNAVETDNTIEDYKLFPFMYSPGRANVEFNSSTATNIENVDPNVLLLGLKYFKFYSVNIDKDCIVPDLCIAVFDGEWSITSNVGQYDTNYFDITFTYVANSPGYKFTGIDIAVFYKIMNRTLQYSNFSDVTMIDYILTDGTNDYPIRTCYLLNIDVIYPNEYLGTSKMLNYDPNSGLLSYNGNVDRINKLHSLNLFNVNLNTNSLYNIGVMWSIYGETNSPAGFYDVNRKHLSITYEIANNVTLSSTRFEIAKFYSLESSNDNSSYISNDTIVRIPLPDDPVNFYTYLDCIEVNAGAEHFATKHIEYDPHYAKFRLLMNSLVSFKKIKIYNVNTNASYVFSRTLLNGCNSLSYSSVSPMLNIYPVNERYNDLVIEYNGSQSGPLGPLGLTGDIDLFQLTRVETLDNNSNIAGLDINNKGTIIEYYWGSTSSNINETYFTQHITRLVNSPEFITCDQFLHYSIYDGTLSLGYLNLSSTYKHVEKLNSLQLCNTYLDTNSNLNENNVITYINNSNTASIENVSQNDIFYEFEPINNDGINIYISPSQFTRFYRLNITQTDITSSNITEDTVFYYSFKNGLVTLDNIPLSLLKYTDETEDDYKVEYYSKGNYIHYNNSLEELFLRRSIIPHLHKIVIRQTLVDVNIDVFLKNEEWTLSNAINNNKKDLIFDVASSRFDYADEESDFEIGLCVCPVISTILSSSMDIDENSIVELYIRSSTEPIITNNSIIVTQRNTNIKLDYSYKPIIYNNVNGKITTYITGVPFNQLHKVTLRGVNLDASCIYTRTFNNLDWTVSDIVNYYDSELRDVTFTFNSGPYIGLLGELVLGEFYKTVNQALNFSNIDAGVVTNSASYTTNHGCPVVWYIDPNENPFTYYLIDLPANNNEMYSQNHDILKFYNNRGVLVTEPSTTSRIHSISSIVFQNVNFTLNEIYELNSGIISSVTHVESSDSNFVDTRIDFLAPIVIDSTLQNNNEQDIITVYSVFLDSINDVLLNSNTVILADVTYNYNGTSANINTTIPINLIQDVNIPYYKLGGLINYSSNTGDLTFLQKQIDTSTSIETVYKIELENVNANSDNIYLRYGLWTAASRRVGALYFLTFTYDGTPDNNGAIYDTFTSTENFINICLLLGYYSGIYGSSLINNDTISYIEFKSNLTTINEYAKGKFVSLVSGTGNYNLNFDQNLKYPVPTNLYQIYKEYNFILFTGDARKDGNNTLFSVFGTNVLTDETISTNKTVESFIVANNAKIHIIRYTVLKSKIAPYNFVCEESGNTSFSVTEKDPSLGNINISVFPTKNINAKYPGIPVLQNNLGNNNYVNFEVLNSIYVIILSKYDGSEFNNNVIKLLSELGTNIATIQKKLKNNGCYMCILFQNPIFLPDTDLSSIPKNSRNNYTFTRRKNTTIIYEDTSDIKLAILFPYAQMSTYMKHHYEALNKKYPNSSMVPSLMVHNAENILHKYRENSIVYNVNTF